MNSAANPETLADIVREMRMGNTGMFPFAYLIGDPDTPEVVDAISGAIIWQRKINIRRVTIADLAGRIEAAAERERSKWERERRSYEKLHDCFWDRNAIQNIVRQMLGARDDLRRVNPREADDLQYYAHELMRAARSASGDAAAMRAALEGVVKYLGEIIPTRREIELVKSVRAALSAPPRNCDVGTPEEQQERFREFCRSHNDAGECGIGRTHAKCPCWRGPKNPDCALSWVQMPYEKGVDHA